MMLGGSQEESRSVLEELKSSDARLLALDALSPWSLLLVQFVDDTFLVQSTLFGLRCQ